MSLTRFPHCWLFGSESTVDACNISKCYVAENSLENVKQIDQI